MGGSARALSAHLRCRVPRPARGSRPAVVLRLLPFLADADRHLHTRAAIAKYWLADDRAQPCRLFARSRSPAMAKLYARASAARPSHRILSLDVARWCIRRHLSPACWRPILFSRTYEYPILIVAAPTGFARRVRWRRSQSVISRAAPTLAAIIVVLACALYFDRLADCRRVAFAGRIGRACGIYAVAAPSTLCAFCLTRGAGFRHHWAPGSPASPGPRDHAQLFRRASGRRNQCPDRFRAAVSTAPRFTVPSMFGDLIQQARERPPETLSLLLFRWADLGMPLQAHVSRAKRARTASP